MDKLEKMINFLEIYNLPILKQGKRKYEQSTSNKIEAVIEKLSINKCLRSDGFVGEFYQTFRKELTFIFLKLPRNCRGRNTSKLIL